MTITPDLRLTASFDKVGLSVAVTSVALLPMGGVALAQNAPPTWTGVYVGGQLGWVGTRAQTNTFFADGYATATGLSKNRINGPSIGAYYGYNRQFGSLVAGIEGDINARFGSSGAALMLPGLGKANGLAGGPGTIRVKREWDTSLRARLGFLLTERLMMFGTAGVSWADFTFSGLLPGFPAGATDALNRLSGVRRGAVFGGGFEYALNENWHAKIEALHTIYSARRSSYAGNVGEDTYLANFRSKVKSTTVRIGISHRFGTGGGSSLP